MILNKLLKLKLILCIMIIICYMELSFKIIVIKISQLELVIQVQKIYLT